MINEKYSLLHRIVLFPTYRITAGCCWFSFSTSPRGYDSADRVSGGTGSTAVPAKFPRDGFVGSEMRRRSLPHTSKADVELAVRDHQLAELEAVATERLIKIRNLEQSTTEHIRQIDCLLADRDWLSTRVEDLTGEVDRLSSELERMKSAPSEFMWPASRHSSPLSRRSSPVRSAVITELKQLLESNQVTAKRLKDELNQISRKSKDEDTAVAGLQSVYKDLSNCCTELEASLHQSTADFDRLFTPELVCTQSLH